MITKTEKILKFIQQKSVVTTPNVSNALDIPYTTVSGILTSLWRRGLLQKDGRTRPCKYSLKPESQDSNSHSFPISLGNSSSPSRLNLQTTEPDVKEELEQILSRLLKHIEFPLKRCKSPLEKKVLLPFIDEMLQQPFIGLKWVDYDEMLSCDGKRFVRRLTPGFLLKDKYSDEQYSLDFSLLWPRSDGKGVIKIAIECDGHEFHEKTPRQAERDKKRDRIVQKNGWFILRFSGSQIVNNPSAVFAEIKEFALAKDMELSGHHEFTSPNRSIHRFGEATSQPARVG